MDLKDNHNKAIILISFFAVLLILFLLLIIAFPDTVDKYIGGFLKVPTTTTTTTSTTTTYTLPPNAVPIQMIAENEEPVLIGSTPIIPTTTMMPLNTTIKPVRLHTSAPGNCNACEHDGDSKPTTTIITSTTTTSITTTTTSSTTSTTITELSEFPFLPSLNKIFGGEA